MSKSLSLVSGPSVPSIFTTTEKQDYVTGQYYPGRAYPIFNDCIEERQISFDNGFFVYVQPRVYHSLADKQDDTWKRLQCACERIYAMTHTPEEWLQLMGRHCIDIEWYDFIKKAT